MTEKETKNTNRVIQKIENSSLTRIDLKSLTKFELKFVSLLPFCCNPKSGDKQSVIDWNNAKIYRLPNILE